MTDDLFLDADYKPDEPKGGNYLRFEQGENRFRILERPITGYVWWIHADGTVVPRGERSVKGNKPVRAPKNKKHPLYRAIQMDEYEAAKEFWAMQVWDYKSKQIKILEITQSGILQTITTLARSEDWGSPLNYDIVVNREGEGLDTEYQVVPLPPKELAMDARKAIMESKIKVEELFTGGDPFNPNPNSEENYEEFDPEKAIT